VPEEEDRAELGEAGRRFLDRVLEHVTIDFVQGALLIEAAHLLDTLAIWRALAPTDPRAAQVAISCTRAVASLVGQAGIR